MSASQEYAWNNSQTWSELLAQVSQLIWLEDDVGNLLYSNKQTPHTPVVALDFFSLFVHPDDFFSFKLQYQTGRLHQSPFEIRSRVKIHEHYHWHLFKIQPSLTSTVNTSTWIGSAIDVQQAYDLHLRESISAPSFKELANAMPQLVWVAEKNGEVIYYNDRIAEFYGARLNESGNWSWEAMLHEDDIQKTSDAWSFSLSSGNKYEIEHRAMMRNGEYRWMLSRGLPVHDLNGDLLRWYGTATDIHAIKTAEALSAAREREVVEAKNQLELSISAGNIGLWNWNLLNNDLFWSDQMCQLYGLKPNEWTNTIEHFRTMVVPEDLNTIFESAANTSSDKPEASYRFRIIRKDGQTRWIEARSKTLFSPTGEAEKLIGVNIDITDQMLAAEAIRESELRFRTLAESLPQMIWMTDADGNLLYHSKNWFKYTGKTVFENLWLQTIHPDDLTTSREAWLKAKEKESSFRYEVRLLNANNEYRWHLSVAEPVKDSEGKIEKWIGAISDITEQKDFTTKLEELVKSRTTELQRSNDDLQQFAHVASHDLKEPVRKIQLFVNLLQSEIQHQVTPVTEMYLQKIVKSVTRMNSMIDGVLKYSGIEAIQSGKEPVNLNTVITLVWEDLEIMVKEKNAVLQVEELPVWPLHQILIYQLFYNLIYNSLKFTREGKPPVITIKKNSVQSQKSLSLVLSDNGIGFDPAENESIFKTFRRLHSKDQYEGSGLGLALCKKIVERHEGKIRALGRPGLGAEFYIDFPENY